MWHELRAIFDGLNAAADTPRVLLYVAKGWPLLRSAARF